MRRECISDNSAENALLFLVWVMRLTYCVYASLKLQWSQMKNNDEG